MRSAVSRGTLRSSSRAAGWKTVRNLLTTCQRLGDHIFEGDAVGPVGHPLVDDPVELALLPLLVLAQDLDRDDRGHRLPAARDDGGLAVAVGALDDLGEVGAEVADGFGG